MRTETSLYQLKIALKNCTPPVWRRIIVPADMLLPELHFAIQSVMGWEDYHLHHFLKGKQRYVPPMEEDCDLMDKTSIFYTDVPLLALLSKPNDSLTYEYDFGDSWVHDVVLEKITPYDASLTTPVCTHGQNACPPEDSGGVEGYRQICEVLNDPQHPEHHYVREWMGLEEPGDMFDPTLFDLDEANERLRNR